MRLEEIHVKGLGPVRSSDAAGLFVRRIDDDDATSVCETNRDLGEHGMVRLVRDEPEPHRTGA
jgi:hypothetical protein